MYLPVLASYEQRGAFLHRFCVEIHRWTGGASQKLYRFLPGLSYIDQNLKPICLQDMTIAIRHAHVGVKGTSVANLVSARFAARF